MEGLLIPTEGAEGWHRRGVFEELHFASRGLSLPRNMYHVYRGPKDYVPIEADSAYQAMRESGIERPVKIRRYLVHRIPFLTGDMLVDAPQMAEGAALPNH